MLTITQIITLVPFAYLLAVSVPLIVTDIRERRLPNKYVIPFIAISFLAGLCSAIFAGAWITFGLTLLVSLLCGVGLMVLNQLGALGMGDIKLLFGISLNLGMFWLWGIPVLIVGSILITAGYALIAVKFFRRGIGASVPMGVVVVPTAIAMLAWLVI